MNLFGIEMMLLVLGIGLTVFGVMQTIAILINIIDAIYKKIFWEWNIKVQVILITIGIVLIIISQNI